MAHDRNILRQVAALHSVGLDRGFLSRLGPRFLVQLYAAIDAGPDSVLIVEQRNGKVVGFVTGGSGMGPIYRRLLHRPFSLGLALFPSLLRPSMLKGMIELVYRRSADDPGCAGGTLPEHELFSIVVSVEMRGTGIAESLYNRLCAQFRAQGVPAFQIVVGESLSAAHRFYRRMGAEPVLKTSVHKGQISTVYAQQLR